MKTNELRIGNHFIPFTEDGTELECRAITAVELYFLSNHPEKGEPITLTEEWLVKFGFEYSKERESETSDFDEWVREGFYLGLLNNDYYIINGLDQGGFSVEVRYVHQLQNLYFALTGNELTLNEITS